MRGVVGVAALAAVASGAPVIDGDRSEWSETTRVVPAFFDSYDGTAQDALYMESDDSYFYMLFKPREGWAMHTSVVYLNVDLDRETGYTGPLFVPRGFDLQIKADFKWWPVGDLGDDKFSVYGSECPERDSSCEVAKLFQLEADDFRTVQGGAEIRISKELLALHLNAQPEELQDLQVATLLSSRDAEDSGLSETVATPSTYSNWLRFYPEVTNMPACEGVSDEQRGAVVFSNEVRDNFFQDKAYSQLFAAMQYQLFQAGITHDRINAEDLKDVSKICKYDVLMIPYLAYINEEDFAAFHKSLHQAMFHYGVGVVTTGNFMTNKANSVGTLPGDPYWSMETLLGISDASPVFAEVTRNVVTVKDTSSIFSDMTVGEALYDEFTLGTFINMYKPRGGSDVRTVTVLADTNFDTRDGLMDQTYHAILATEQEGANVFGKTTGRVVHFNTLEVLANSDLAWRAAQWVLQGKREVSLGLMSSRFNHVMTMRNDCDQSMFKDEFVELETNFLESYTKPWYSTYNFVGSYYVNIGNDKPAGEHTVWATSKVVYNQWLALENEIGSHSYTHPHNISDPAINLEFEFKQSMDIIASKLNLDRIASAQPGATETLQVAKEMEKWMADTYFSGGYSGVRAGYPGVFGFLDDESPMVYVAPNYYFDFTMIGFYKWTADRALAYWKEQMLNNTKWANQGFGHIPFHDYGPGNWGSGPNADLKPYFGGGPGYEPEMFEGIIAEAYNNGHEFITTMDLSDRIRAHDATTMTVTEAGANALSATVTPAAGNSLGKMTLSLVQLGLNKVIVSCGAHYAFNDRFVFLPANGGTFEVTYANSAPATAAVTHINYLPMRAELLSVSGDGTNLLATFKGRGEVRVSFDPASGTPTGTSSTSKNTLVSGSEVVFEFDTVGEHTLSVNF